MRLKKQSCSQNFVKVPLPEITFEGGKFNVRRYDISADEFVDDLKDADIFAFDAYIRGHLYSLTNSLIRWAEKRIDEATKESVT